MAGAFQTSREIFNNPIWNDVTKFRLFFFIYGQAIFSESGYVIGNFHLKRGQYLRSFRNLRDDLQYLENRSVKKYSLSTISKKVGQLVKEGRLKIEDTELGTLFTVVNYASYQGLDNYKNNSENAERTDRERRENSNETQRERTENNNKKVNKVKKDNNEKKLYKEFVKLTEEEHLKLIEQLGQALTDDLIERLNNYIGSKGKQYKSHYHTILTWSRKDKPKEVKHEETTKPDNDKSRGIQLFK